MMIKFTTVAPLPEEKKHFSDMPLSYLVIIAPSTIERVIKNKYYSKTNRIDIFYGFDKSILAHLYVP